MLLKKFKNLSFLLFLILSINAYSSSLERVRDTIPLDWVYELNEEDKDGTLSLFKDIVTKSKEENAVNVIRLLSGFTNTDGDISFLDTIPDDNDLKKRAFATFNQIADLAKVGNTQEIISMLNNTISGYKGRHTHYNFFLQTHFPIERKNSLVSFLKRNEFASDIIRTTITTFAGETIDNSTEMENLYGICNCFNIHFKEIFFPTYDLNFSSLEFVYTNLEDFGAGFRSFQLWKKDLTKLTNTLNPANKPRIIELLNYAKETFKD